MTELLQIEIESSKIAESYNFDDAFRAWLRQLPDLDEADKTAPKASNFGLV